MSKLCAKFKLVKDADPKNGPERQEVRNKIPGLLCVRHQPGRVAMTYRYDARNPKTVAEMTDANALRGLACALDLNIEDLATAGARAATMHAITILNGAARSLTP